MNEHLPTLVVVTVAEGIGEKNVPGGGEILAVGVIPPNDSAQYDIAGYDCDNFLLYLGDDVVGKVNMPCQAQVYDHHKVKISDATVDGTYKVKIWWSR